MHGLSLHGVPLPTRGTGKNDGVRILTRAAPGAATEAAAAIREVALRHRERVTASLLQLDGAWRDGVLGLPTVDASVWGPRLRFSAPGRTICEFTREVAPRLGRFVLFGSGDFHHLTRVFARRFTRERGVAVVVFDNHPDWDVRPPEWSCGGWTGRLAQDHGVASVTVWGCANFELRLPTRLFADSASLVERRLVIRPWAERQPRSVRSRYACIDRANWAAQIEEAASAIAADAVYVSVDLDCLRGGEALTNWENGRFSAADVALALRLIRRQRPIVGGDVCGAWSPCRYARAAQRLAAAFDHPRVPATDVESARRVNMPALSTIWPALVGDR